MNSVGCDIAFINCKNITNLIIKDNITAIGPNAFLNCSNIEVITLPNSLERVGSNVFNGCSNLVRVESNIQNPISIPSNLFTNANSNEKILYVPQNSLKFYEKSNGWKNGFTYSMEGSMNDVVFKYKDDHGTYVCDMTFASATYSSDAGTQYTIKIVGEMQGSDKFYVDLVEQQFPEGSRFQPEFLSNPAS